MEEFHYHPFGMRMEGDYFRKLRHFPAKGNAYQYNGKELYADLGFDWMPYGARYYDAAVGRFVGVDPLAADYAAWSTYNYVFGNPISFIDPDGRSGENVNNEYIRDLKTGKTTQISTVGGDEVDIVYNGATNEDGSFTVTSQEVMDVQTSVPETSEMSIRLPGVNMVSGANGAVETAFSPIDGAVFAVAGVPALVVTAFKTLTAAKEPAGKGAANPKVADAIAKGNRAHKDFSKRASEKGWEVEPRLTDPKTGKTVKPDAVTPSGHPVELKPNTPSGRAQGKRQLPKYERATSKNGRVIYYDPSKY